MSTNEKSERQYIDGYNNGYLMSRFEPQLYKQIMAGQDITQPYFEGMAEGHRMQERELYLKGLENSRKVNQHLKPKMK